jgi:hypothetical protein
MYAKESWLFRNLEQDPGGINRWIYRMCSIKECLEIFNSIFGFWISNCKVCLMILRLMQVS